MATMQIKNMPDSLHRKLAREAKRQGITMSQLALDAIGKAIAKREFSERLNGRPLTDLGISASKLLEDARKAREDK